jgi:hypothetical protein
MQVDIVIRIARISHLASATHRRRGSSEKAVAVFFVLFCEQMLAMKVGKAKAKFRIYNEPDDYVEIQSSHEFLPVLHISAKSLLASGGRDSCR